MMPHHTKEFLARKFIELFEERPEHMCTFIQTVWENESWVGYHEYDDDHVEVDLNDYQETTLRALEQLLHVIVKG